MSGFEGVSWLALGVIAAAIVLTLVQLLRR